MRADKSAAPSTPPSEEDRKEQLIKSSFRIAGRTVRLALNAWANEQRNWIQSCLMAENSGFTVLERDYFSFDVELHQAAERIRRVLEEALKHPKERLKMNLFASTWGDGDSEPSEPMKEWDRLVKPFQKLGITPHLKNSEIFEFGPFFILPLNYLSPGLNQDIERWLAQAATGRWQAWSRWRVGKKDKKNPLSPLSIDRITSLDSIDGINSSVLEKLREGPKTQHIGYIPCIVLPKYYPLEWVLFLHGEIKKSGLLLVNFD